MSTSNPPQFPAGDYVEWGDYSAEEREELVAELEQAPEIVKQSVEGLDNSQLDTKYKNWTIRQIVHHVADSHVNSYMRFKWTLAEETPTIKAYEEADWVALSDSAAGAVDPPLSMLRGLHEKWVQVLESMTESEYARAFIHPQSGDTVTLWEALNYYPWHGRHHTGQILWLREQNGW